MTSFHLLQWPIVKKNSFPLKFLKVTNTSLQDLEKESLKIKSKKIKSKKTTFFNPPKSILMKTVSPLTKTTVEISIPLTLKVPLQVLKSAKVSETSTRLWNN